MVVKEDDEAMNMVVQRIIRAVQERGLRTDHLERKDGLPTELWVAMLCIECGEACLTVIEDKDSGHRCQGCRSGLVDENGDPLDPETIKGRKMVIQ